MLNKPMLFGFSGDYGEVRDVVLTLGPRVQVMSQRKLVPWLTTPFTGTANLENAFQVTQVTNKDESVMYQASSPDEVAIVTWAASVPASMCAT
jgi:phospholipid-translocating ATPase